MKKKKISSVIAVLFCFIALTGCMDKKGMDATDITDTDPSIQDKDTENKMDTIEEKAKNDVANGNDVTKEKINEAITYIHKHIDDPFKDEKTTETLAYYGAYLKHAGNDTHEISKMGEHVHTYVKDIYNKTKKEMDETSTTLKKEIKNQLDKIENKKDEIIDEFHLSLKKATENNTINE